MVLFIIFFPPHSHLAMLEDNSANRITTKNLEFDQQSHSIRDHQVSEAVPEGMAA
jgi:hypothetical protein